MFGTVCLSVCLLRLWNLHCVLVLLRGSITNVWLSGILKHFQLKILVKNTVFVGGLNLTHEYPPCIPDGNNISSHILDYLHFSPNLMHKAELSWTLCKRLGGAGPYAWGSGRKVYFLVANVSKFLRVTLIPCACILWRSDGQTDAN